MNIKKTITTTSFILIFSIFTLIFIYKDELFTENIDKSNNSSLANAVESNNNLSSSELDVLKAVKEDLEKEDVTNKENTTKPTKKTTFTISKKSATGGDILVITIYNLPKGKKIKVDSDFNFNPDFYNIDDKFVALLPISYNIKTGTHLLTITANDVTKSYKIKLKDKKWDVQKLYINSNLNDNDSANNEYNKKIIPLKLVADDEMHWDSDFIIPVKGKITTTFGTIRYTNNEKESSRHSGVDIATAKGTKIVAPNNGRVIFSGFLKLTGYTVLIEHGLGLKTYYYHMDSINVKLNQMVKKGKKIGEVGTTGYSTGPHLHFSMSVNDVYVDPFLDNIDMENAA